MGTGEAVGTEEGLALVDFFAGCGGVSRGFAESGIAPVVAVDHDRDAAASYQLNFPSTAVIEKDIRDVRSQDVERSLRSAGEAIRVFAGCAPCQPFAHHRNGKSARASDSRLLMEFLRFVDELRPELVFIENVPGIRLPSGVLAEFVSQLPSDYAYEHTVVRGEEYGVPQARRRLVLIASRLGPVAMPSPTHGRSVGVPCRTVRDMIHDLPSVNAGERNPTIPDHEAMRLSPANLERIRATPEGGDRRDWPKRLWPVCHQDRNVGHTDAYGRLRWDSPAPTLTARCISYSNGRFGHPEQDRAITVREAARLQTFPDEFKFAGGLTSKARQIGNAVPVALAHVVGEALVRHVADCR